MSNYTYSPICRLKHQQVEATIYGKAAIPNVLKALKEVMSITTGD